MRAALDEGSPKVHEAGNKSYVWPFAQGDIDAAFRDAPVVIERDLPPAAADPLRDGAARGGRQTGVAGEFTLWSSTQIPHVLRFVLRPFTGIPEQNIRVIAPDVGGGFGSKLQVTAEEVLAVLVARKLGRPVKWTESRSEGNLTVHHGRDQWQRIRIAADRDGRLRGLEVDLLADMGAYLMLVTPGVPLLGRVHVSRPSTRWTRTRSSAPACSPRRCRPTPTAARAARRRPSPSSGSWTSSPPSSAWTRWSCGSGTGSSTRSSRTPRSPR